MRTFLRLSVILLVPGVVLSSACRDTGTNPAPAPVDSVEIVAPAPSLAVGGSLQLAATLRDSAGNVLPGRPVTWSSGDAAVATVSGEGRVSGHAAGQAAITAESEGRRHTVTLRVLGPVHAVALSADSVVVAPGTTLRVAATVRDAGGNVLEGIALAWESSDSMVATVDGTGLVTGLAGGRATITAAHQGVAGALEVEVPVDIAELYLARYGLPLAFTVRVGGVTHLGVVVLNRAGRWVQDAALQWSTSSPAVATVDADGAVRGVSPGTATITVRGGTKRDSMVVVVGRGYTLTFLHDTEWEIVVPRAINERGDIVGTLGFSPMERAFLFRDGTFSLLFPEGHGDAWAVNESGTVVGSFTAPDGVRHAYRREGGVVTDLSPGATLDTYARGIDDAGRVAGHVWRAGPNGYQGSAVVWEEGGGASAIGIPGDRVVASVAMSPQGEVAGSGWLLSGGSDLVFALRGGEFRSFDAASTRPVVAAVGAGGHVVGWLETIDQMDAFVWSGGQPTIIPGIRGGWMQATAVNAHGQVVGQGTAMPQLDPPRGWVLLEGLPAELTRLVEQSGWTILSTGAIDDAGRIAVIAEREGIQRGLALLTPLP